MLTQDTHARTCKAPRRCDSLLATYRTPPRAGLRFRQCLPFQVTGEACPRLEEPGTFKPGKAQAPPPSAGPLALGTLDRLLIGSS